MRRFYTVIINHQKTILLLFLILAVICLGLSQFVKVNYDIHDYLPEYTASTVSIEVMNEEFQGGIPNARVMVQDVTIPEALEYKEKLQSVEGVYSVTWLDDAVNITQPLSTLEPDTVESYYRNSTALFTVTIEENQYINAAADIRDIIGENNSMAGNAISTAATTSNTVTEVPQIAIMAVLFVILILVITTKSWAEPVLILIGLGAAIIINSGTNVIFGEISFVTNASCSILQLAVSLDYSVFLIHRFEECRRTESDEKKAMVNALCGSTTSILSSGLTTVIGFLALALMQFKIGPDLGIALAKGVIISLLTVFIFFPVLILKLYKFIDKTNHRPLLPEFKKFGKAVFKITIPLVCVFAIIVVPAYLGYNANDYYYGASRIFGDDTQVGTDMNDIEKVFGLNNTMVLMVPAGNTAYETALSKELHDLPHVKGIISFVDMAGAEIPTEYLDKKTLAQLVSDNYSRMVISSDLPDEGDETFALVEQIRNTAEKYYPGENYLAGQSVSTYDLMDTVTADMLKVNLLAIAAVFIVLMLTMRSFFLPVILVLSIETAIWLNISVPYFMGERIYYVAYLIISSIQLGSTVDYAILMTDRYRENRISLEKKDSVIKTISDVTVSIATSGSVMTIVGLLMGYISSNQLLAQLGVFIGRGALFSMTIVLFVLPGFLYLLDRLIIKKNRRKHNIFQEVSA